MQLTPRKYIWHGMIVDRDYLVNIRFINKRTKAILRKAQLYIQIVVTIKRWKMTSFIWNHMFMLHFWSTWYIWYSYLIWIILTLGGNKAFIWRPMCSLNLYINFDYKWLWSISLLDLSVATVLPINSTWLPFFTIHTIRSSINKQMYSK